MPPDNVVPFRRRGARSRRRDPFAAMVTANAAFWSTPEANMTQVAIAADLAEAERCLIEARQGGTTGAAKVRRAIGDQSRERVRAEAAKLAKMPQTMAARLIAPKVGLSAARTLKLLRQLDVQKNS